MLRALIYHLEIHPKKQIESVFGNLRKQLKSLFIYLLYLCTEFFTKAKTWFFLYSLIFFGLHKLFVQLQNSFDYLDLEKLNV